jgi:hypothetical protein
VALTVGLTTSAALASTTTARHVMFTFLGATVRPNENVYDVRGTGFRGAAVQVVKVNKAGTAGTDTATAYSRLGTTVSADSFTLSGPDKNGIISIKGSGHFVRGTGKYAHVSGHYTFAGTDNTKTNVIKVTATGTESL